MPGTAPASDSPARRAHAKAPSGAPRKAEKVGVLGGMFNPPHAGHVELARAALRELRLDRVLLVPALVPPHKPVACDPGADRRAQMCRLAVRAERRIEVSTLELERPGPSYTVDTLRLIQANQPDAELTLILGADMAATLGSWREPRAIIELARVAVAQRTGASRRQVLDALMPLGGSGRVDFLEMQPRELSSSQVRRALADGEPVAEMVGPEVAAYIDEHGLYGRGVKGLGAKGSVGASAGGGPS